MLIPLVVGKLEALCDVSFAHTLLRRKDKEEIKKDLELNKAQYHDAFYFLYDELETNLGDNTKDEIGSMTPEEFIEEIPLYKYVK